MNPGKYFIHIITSTLFIFCLSAADVGTLTQPVPDAVSFSPHSWLTISPGCNPSELCFSWATVHQTATDIPYTPIFSDTNSLTYRYYVPKVQIVKQSGCNTPTPDDFRDIKKVTTFSGISLKAIGTELGKTDDDEVYPIIKDAGWYQNKVTVRGLDDMTTYAYRVGYDTVWSGINTFTTRNPAAFGFILVGDPQLGAYTKGTHAKEEQKASIEVYDSIGWQRSVSAFTQRFPEVSFIVSVGDQVENYTSIATNDIEYTSFFAPLELLRLPVATVCGNHEYYLGQYYGHHFNFPNLSPYGATENGNDGDYWFTYGDVLFMMLNSNMKDVAEHDIFIDKTIRLNPKVTWRVVCFHHALFSNADHPFDSEIMFRRAIYPKMIDKYDIDVVFAGHDHQYSRSKQLFNGAPVSKDRMFIAPDSSITVYNPHGTVYFDLNSGSDSKYYDLNATLVDSATGKITYPAYTAKFWQGYEPSFSHVTADRYHFSIATYALSDLYRPIDRYTIVKSKPFLPMPGGNEYKCKKFRFR